MPLMARAGLAHVEFGSDSFSDTVLAAYHKRFAFDDVLLSSELARNAHVLLPFHHRRRPGRNPRDTARDFANSQRFPGAVILAVVGMRIYPGTHLASRARQEGIIGPATNLLSRPFTWRPASPWTKCSTGSGSSPRRHRAGSWETRTRDIRLLWIACAAAGSWGRSGATLPRCSGSGLRAARCSPPQARPAASATAVPRPARAPAGLAGPGVLLDVGPRTGITAGMQRDSTFEQRAAGRPWEAFHA